MHMAAKSLESESFNEELAPSNFDTEASDVNNDIVMTTSISGAQENVPTENGNGTIPSRRDTGELNPDVTDSNLNGNSTHQSSTHNSSRLRKFVTSAKERFDSIEPGWAQRKTS